jgi:hypothetical protein
MLAMPFVVFVAWRLLAPSAGPPRVLVIAVAGTAAAMTALLLVLWYEEAAPLGAIYIPAQLDKGRILPSRVERPPPPARVEADPPGQLPIPGPALK